MSLPKPPLTLTYSVINMMISAGLKSDVMMSKPLSVNLTTLSMTESANCASAGSWSPGLTAA